MTHQPFPPRLEERYLRETVWLHAHAFHFHRHPNDPYYEYALHEPGSVCVAFPIRPDDPPVEGGRR